MPLGRIARVRADRGFGFIKADEAPGDVFFHMRGCLCDFDALWEGREVEFEFEPSDKGLRAYRIQVRDEAAGNR